METIIVVHILQRHGKARYSRIGAIVHIWEIERGMSRATLLFLRRRLDGPGVARKYSTQISQNIPRCLSLCPPASPPPRGPRRICALPQSANRMRSSRRVSSDGGRTRSGSASGRSPGTWRTNWSAAGCRSDADSTSERSDGLWSSGREALQLEKR